MRKPITRHKVSDFVIYKKKNSENILEFIIDFFLLLEQSDIVIINSDLQRAATRPASPDAALPSSRIVLDKENTVTYLTIYV